MLRGSGASSHPRRRFLIATVTDYWIVRFRGRWPSGFM